MFRIFISISPLPEIALFSVCECPGCCSRQAWEELLGQPRCPCALPVLSCQFGRHSLEFGPAFLYINTCESSLKDKDFPLTDLVVCLTFHCATKPLDFKALSGLCLPHLHRKDDCCKQRAWVARGYPGSGTCSFHLHKGFSTGAKSRERRQEGVLGWAAVWLHQAGTRLLGCIPTHITLPQQQAEEGQQGHVCPVKTLF